MRRREFITLVGGTALWPLAARAQQRERVLRIGAFMGAPSAGRDVRVSCGSDASPSGVVLFYRPSADLAGPLRVPQLREERNLNAAAELSLFMRQSYARKKFARPCPPEHKLS
jgi:hypothetical protein